MRLSISVKLSPSYVAFFRVFRRGIEILRRIRRFFFFTAFAASVRRFRLRVFEGPFSHVVIFAFIFHGLMASVNILHSLVIKTKAAKKCSISWETGMIDRTIAPYLDKHISKGRAWPFLCQTADEILRVSIRVTVGGDLLMTANSG